MAKHRTKRIVLVNPAYSSCVTFDQDPQGNDNICLAFKNGKGTAVSITLGPQHAANLAKEILEWLPHTKPTRAGH